MDRINVDELFKCFNCEFMVDEPHESECCGKLYCHSCVVELAFFQCKLCKKSIKFRQNVFAKNLLQKVELKCRHLCGGKFNHEEMKLHIYRCDSRIFRCTIEFCSFYGKKEEMVAHMNQNHEIYLIALLEQFEEFSESMDKVLNTRKVFKDVNLFKDELGISSIPLNRIRRLDPIENNSNELLGRHINRLPVMNQPLFRRPIDEEPANFFSSNLNHITHDVFRYNLNNMSHNNHDLYNFQGYSPRGNHITYNNNPISNDNSIDYNQQALDQINLNDMSNNSPYMSGYSDNS
jgi:hypothetical protein